MPDKEEHQNNTRESDRRERGRNKDGRDGRGTLFIFACAIFANTEMSLFLEVFQWPLAEIEDKKKTERERGLRETHDEHSALGKLLTTAGVCHGNVRKVLFSCLFNKAINV